LRPFCDGELVINKDFFQSLAATGPAITAANGCARTRAGVRWRGFRARHVACLPPTIADTKGVSVDDIE
jgi:hypothetical protein